MISNPKLKQDITQLQKAIDAIKEQARAARLSHQGCRPIEATGELALPALEPENKAHED